MIETASQALPNVESAERPDSSHNAKKIHLLFVVNRLKRRGTETQLLHLIKKLTAMEFNVSIFQFSPAKDSFPELLSDGITVLCDKYVVKYGMIKVIPLWKFITAGKYDVLITVGLGSALFFGRLCGLVAGVPIVYSILGTYKNNHNAPRIAGRFFDVFNQMLNLFLGFYRGKTVFRLLPNSQILAKLIKEEAPKYNVQVLYNGIPEDDLLQVQSYKPTRTMISVANRIAFLPTIIQVGALDSNKNHQFTLECLESILNEVPDLCYLIVGDGPTRNYLVNFTLTKHLKKHVIFTGQIDRLASLYLMKYSNVLVLTSNSESCPNVLLEAQAMSVPVICFDVGGATEIITSEKTGFIVNKDDKEGFTECVIRLASDDHLAKLMGATAKRRVFSEFGMDKRVAKLLSLIEGDLKKSSV